LEKWIPGDKKTRATPENIKETDSSDHSPTDIEIEGLDAKKGKHLSGGTIEYYCETLAIFYEDGLDRIKKIRACYETGNLPLYITHVHALKSASANIGADNISKTAYDLEMAGLRKESAYIKTNNEPFLSALELLLDNINKALTLRSATGANAISLDERQLKTILVELKTALESMDIETINRNVDILSNISSGYDGKFVVRKMLKLILAFEYDEAAALIDTLLQSF